MKRSDFFEKWKETIEIEQEVTENTSLSGVDEWDSLAAVTTLALFNKEFGLKINAQDIKKCATVGDILNLGNAKYA